MTLDREEYQQLVERVRELEKKVERIDKIEEQCEDCCRKMFLKRQLSKRAISKRD